MLSFSPLEKFRQADNGREKMRIMEGPMIGLAFARVDVSISEIFILFSFTLPSPCTIPLCALFTACHGACEPLIRLKEPQRKMHRKNACVAV